MVWLMNLLLLSVSVGRICWVLESFYLWCTNTKPGSGSGPSLKVTRVTQSCGVDGLKRLLLAVAEWLAVNKIPSLNVVAEKLLIWRCEHYLIHWQKYLQGPYTQPTECLVIAFLLINVQAVADGAIACQNRSTLVCYYLGNVRMAR